MFKELCTWGYRAALVALAVYGVYCYETGGWSAVLNGPAYYVPIVAKLLMFSGQADLLEKIRNGEVINIKAQAIDFVHWFLCTFNLEVQHFD